MHFKCRSIFLHFECTSKVLSMSKTFLRVTRTCPNVPEYLECTQNAVRTFKMHFDCRRMYYEFSFRRHSGTSVTGV